MKDNNSIRRTTIITTIVCLIPVIIGAILYPQLPEEIATHWDASGNPNGWSSKFVGVIVFPGSLVILNLLFPLILKTDPKYANIDNKIKQFIQWIIPVVAVFASGSTLAAALGKEVNFKVLGPMFMGLLFMAIGNYLPKMSQSYTVGIKIPWTLADEENWNKTHRMAGFLWVIGGILVLLTGLFGFPNEVMITIIVIMVLAPMAYSYLLFRNGNR